MASTAEIQTAYDGSNVTFRMLRAFGWGPLLNLGYYPFGPPLTALNFVLTRGIATPYFRLPLAQIRLVHRAIALLSIGTRMRVLDLACGRGASSFFLASRRPDVQVTGVDILRSNLEAATALYGNAPNMQFASGDATALPFGNGCFDRLLCLEAAFHFPDRLLFLREAARVLRPGGRMVVVDFVWRTAQSPRQVSPDYIELVRRTWRWDHFASFDEYDRNADASGMRIVRQLDWSGHVTDPLQTVFQLVAWLGRRAWGQRLLATYNPLLSSFTAADWSDLQDSARAHTAVRRHSRYAALLIERPA